MFLASYSRNLPHARTETHPISSSLLDTAVQFDSEGQGLARACLCARIAADLRGQDTLVLDLRGVTPIVDFFVVTTGSSSRQMHSLAEEVSRVMKEHGTRALGREGAGSNSVWILHDYGDIVLHVFSPQARAHYDLEHLWADAPRVDWQASSNGHAL